MKEDIHKRPKDFKGFKVRVNLIGSTKNADRSYTLRFRTELEMTPEEAVVFDPLVHESAGMLTYEPDS